jgi:nucleotide-binding universal stress UspA family protein
MMAYKTILLCLNEIDRLPQLIAAARSLATLSNGHVTGLYVIPAMQVYPSAAYSALPDTFDGNQVYFKDNLPKVRSAFEAAMQQDGLSFDFHVMESTSSLLGNDAIAQGRSADLIIVSATDGTQASGVEFDYVERIVIAAGRPVLVLPFRGNAELELDDVLIGWDNGREAARAAFDALPILVKAKNVRLGSVDEAPRGAVSAASIAETLTRHGVNVEITNIPSGGMATGEVLLRAASDFGAGLVVMGAYGHSRLAEFVFGGATRHVLKNLDRPILMSH